MVALQHHVVGVGTLLEQFPLFPIEVEGHPLRDILLGGVTRYVDIVVGHVIQIRQEKLGEDEFILEIRTKGISNF